MPNCHSHLIPLPHRWHCKRPPLPLSPHLHPGLSWPRASGCDMFGSPYGELLYCRQARGACTVSTRTSVSARAQKMSLAESWYVIHVTLFARWTQSTPAQGAQNMEVVLAGLLCLLWSLSQEQVALWNGGFLLHRELCFKWVQWYFLSLVCYFVFIILPLVWSQLLSNS